MVADMTVNIEKYSGAHIDTNNPRQDYLLMVTAIDSTTQLLNLNIIVQGDMKRESEVQKLVRKVNTMTYTIR